MRRGADEQPALALLRDPQDMAALVKDGSGSRSSIMMEAMVSSLVDAQSMLARAMLKAAAVVGMEFYLEVIKICLRELGEAFDDAGAAARSHFRRRGRRLASRSSFSY